MSDNTLRVYVADLHAYNNGQLIGQWVDLNGLDRDEIAAAISGVPGINPDGDGKERNEWAIHDQEGFGNLIGEYPDFATLARLVEIADELDEQWPLYIEWVCQAGNGEYDPDVDDFEGAYRGSYESFRSYAEALFDETWLGDIPEQVQSYIDYDAFARDLTLGGDYLHFIHNGECHVFANY